jgi:hypothetical protein
MAADRAGTGGPAAVPAAAPANGRRREDDLAELAAMAGR